MLAVSLILVAIVAGISLIASALVAICRLLIKSNTLSLALGTFIMPALICALFIYWAMTMDADDASPGNVLMGSFAALAIVTPVALLASHLTIKFLSRRTLRKVR